MRRSAPLLAAALLVGCSSSRPQPVPVDPAIDCLQIARLSAAGEHKPAADGMAVLASRHVVCAAEILAAATESGRLVESADALVRLGLEQQDRGEVNAARRSFREALAIYPKYHWVLKLERELPAAVDVEVASLLQKTSELRAQGRLEEALSALEAKADLVASERPLTAAASVLRAEIAERHLAASDEARQAGNLTGAADLLDRAIGAAPNEEDTRVRILDAARQLGLSLFSGGELMRARSLWRSALALDATDETLLGYIDEVEARLESLNAIKDADDG